MVTTDMETTFRKMEPKVIKYRDYRFFCNDTFSESLQNIISQNIKSNCDDHYNNFAISCKNVLDKIAPWKKKYVRGNHSPFMNKALSKAIMVRTKLGNTFLKNRSEENKKNYNMPRNYCVSLLRKNKRDYYNNLNDKNICDNRKFSKVVEPLLSNKIVSNNKITLVEWEGIIEADQANAKVLNNFFSDITKNFEIPQFNQVDPICQNIRGKVIKAVIKYKNHPSFIATKKGVLIRNSVSHSLKKMIF